MGLAAFNRMRRLKQATEGAAKTAVSTVEISLDDMPYQELRAIAKGQGIEGYHKMNTEELREALKEGE